jgi:alkylation response protein AidB-like acyl-CoA dehydrogenase
MDFDLTEDQLAFQQTARAFARERLLPHAGRWDEERHFPAAELREAAALGFAALYVPEAHGGTGLSRLDAALIFEELAYADPSTAAFLSIHNMVAAMVSRFGNQEQRERFLPGIIAADQFVSYCLTEPGSGSDAAALKTRAVAEGNAQYRVNGSKAFISGGGIADLYVTMLRTGDDSPRGISCVIVEKGADGLSFGKPERKMGWNSQPTSTVNFSDCLVPVANRLGGEGEGFRFAMVGLDGGRINIAACSLGGAQACLDAALAYVRERLELQRLKLGVRAPDRRVSGVAVQAGRYGDGAGGRAADGASRGGGARPRRTRCDAALCDGQAVCDRCVLSRV